MALTKPVVVTIIVVSVVLGLAVIALITVAAVSASKSKNQKVKVYYRGEGVRMAATKRRVNMKPQTWCIGTFNRVLPGSVAVVQGATEVQTSVDLRPALARGDPIKIGPQVFTISQDMRRPFTASQVPLDTSTTWISEHDGVTHAAPGKLLGPSNMHVTAYTCDSVELPYNQWTGPRGGAIGYWDSKGRWHDGDCPGKCPQWYSPLFLGPGGKQMDAPSPATLAKVKTGKVEGVEGEEAVDAPPPQQMLGPRPIVIRPQQHFPMTYGLPPPYGLPTPPPPIPSTQHPVQQQQPPPTHQMAPPFRVPPPAAQQQPLPPHQMAPPVRVPPAAPQPHPDHPQQARPPAHPAHPPMFSPLPPLF
jgi:hypothetical protein